MADYDELLTPYQRIREANQLGERALAAQTASDATRAVNPLTRERELTPAVAVEEPVTTGAVASPQPNPFIRPPLPISTMPLAQQMAWQDREDTKRKEQALLSEQLLRTDISRREDELKQKQTDQGRLMIAELDTLDPSKDDYLRQKAALARKYPAAAGSVEVDRAFGPLDQIHAKLLEHQGKAATAEETLKANFEQKRLEAGYKEADKLGPNVVREYSALASKDPDAANALLAKRQQENLTTTMLQGGMTPADIAKYGTGENFNYQAAQTALKTRGAASTEVTRATQLLTVLNELRTKSGFDPAEALKRGKDPYVDAPGWTPALEQAWTGAAEALNTASPQLPANRAGVNGIPAVQTTPAVSQRAPLEAPIMPLTGAAPTTTKPATKPPEATGKSGRKYIWVNGGWFPANQ